MSPEDTAFIQAIRRKSIEGTATNDELRQATTILRGDRIAASIASTTSRTKKAESAKPVDAGAVLANLRALGQKLSTGPV